MFTSSSRFAIGGQSGINNCTLNVQDGATVNLNNSVYLGNGANSGNSIYVTGVGSTLKISAWGSNRGAGVLSVTDGGTINCPGFNGNANASMTVTDSGANCDAELHGRRRALPGCQHELMNVSSGGILQFTAASPTMTLYSASTVMINGGVLSYSGVTGVDMSANKTATANTVGYFTWQGNNTLRLNGSTDTGGGGANYTFANNRGATNYTALQLYGTTSISRPITFDGANGGSLLVNGATATVSGGVTLNGTVTVTAQGSPSTLTGVITGTGGLTLGAASNGTLTLNSANTYTGDTTVSAGTLQLNNTAALPGTGNLTVNGWLDLNAQTAVSVKGLSGSGTINVNSGNTVSFTVGNNGATSTFSGAITDTSGSISLTKTGAATLRALRQQQLRWLYQR